MKLNLFDRVILALVMLFLGVIGLRPILAPETAEAQGRGSTAQVYVEPGVHVLVAPDNSRRVLGKVMIDLTNGNVWGFPTNTESPYPVNIDPAKNTPPTTAPILLGRYDFSALLRNQ